MGTGPGSAAVVARDDTDEVDDARVEDRRHLEAAIALVARGASRWVMVCGIRDANELAECPARQRDRVAVRALSATSILVARADAIPQPRAAGPPDRRIRNRLAHVAQVVASILR